MYHTQQQLSTTERRKNESESGYSAPATPVNNDSVPEEYGMLNDNNAYQNQTAPAFDDVTEDELPF